ncbi:hypothetical protein Back11_40660 [Paenibacillus baekrokdamisoli]|uniref:Uncharacterized protein n=1 Tax=Paenibacillus baekrokdamisoli TaxID=1712516 RepID=A0A3G9JA54_9BACL|nr:stalk domain-containing protein [Paenibacillus baekrokdamisoli]MBB3068237.1 outer membrane protein assembly factor BamB [Paenibacillus baekrokdamisoli]BBH22721.1 hypothetical protein Back11_40660 [Paenibacillus baekrokdamisoli]
MGNWKKTAISLLSAGVILSIIIGSGQQVMAQNNSNTSYEGLSFSGESNVPLAKPRWTTDIGKPLNELSLVPNVVTGNSSLFYVKDGVLIAKSVTSGTTLWSYGSKLQTNSVHLYGDFLYAYTADGSIYRVAAATGKGTRIYQVKAKPQQGQSAILDLSVDGTAIYLSSAAGLISIHSSTGKENWRTAGLSFPQMPQRVGHTLLVGAVESGAITVNTFYAIDAATGKTLWRLQGSHTGPLKVDGNKLYFLDDWPKNDTSKYFVDIDVVDLTTGKITASKSFFPLEEGKDPMYQYPERVIMDQNDVYAVVGGAGIYKTNFDADISVIKPTLIYDSGKWIAGPYNGKMFFKDEENMGIHGRKIGDNTDVGYAGLDNPVSRMDIINSGMYVGQTDGDIFAFNVTTGKPLFRYKTAARNYGAFQIVGNTLLAQAEGKVYAFDVPAELRKPIGADSGAFSKASAKLTIDGKVRQFEPSMMTSANRMFVPLRFLTEAIGAKVNYNKQNKQTTVTYGDRIFALSEGASYAVVGGKQIPLTFAPATINNALYIPVKDIGDLLGIGVTWNTGARTVEVTTKP